MFDEKNAGYVLKAIKQGKSCIFAGAGVGMEANLPGWDDALKGLASYIGQFDHNIEAIILDRIAKKQYLEAAEFYFLADTIEVNKIHGLEQFFGKPPQINDNLKSLLNLNINQFITTNFDCTLEDSWSQVKQSHIASLSNAPDDFLSAHRLISQDKPLVSHIHGIIIKPTSLVLCRSHYKKLLDISEYFHFLRHLLMTRSILFLGFSFDDPALKAFIEYTKAKLQLICDKPSFAIISDDDRELRDFLQQAGITPVCFKKDKDFSALWGLIRWIENKLRESKIPDQALPSENEEIVKLKYNLASVYTHFKIRRSYKNIYESILAGIVHFAGNILINQGKETKEANICKYIAAFLHISEKEATTIVRKTLDSLIINKQASFENDSYLFTKIDDSIDKDLAIIVKSIQDRCKIRYLYAITIPEDQIRNFIYSSLVADGVRLAHSILTKYPIPEASLEDILERKFDSLFGSKHKDKTFITKTLWSLFNSPNKKEAEILGTISRIAFLTDLSLHEPDLNSLNIKRNIQHIYLDASVLLPAICSFHPRANYYLSLIKRAQKAGMITNVSLGFLEEMVSHRANAIETFEREFTDRQKRFSDFVLYNGSDNINVFLGGFSGWLHAEKDYDFYGYLKECAPYSNIPELVAYLAEIGIIGLDTINELNLDKADIANWNAALLDWYDYYKGHKAKSLIWHEAIQLEALSKANDKGRSSIFVTADKRFIYAAMDIASGWYLDFKVIHYLVMPIQFSYYIDLDEEKKIDWRAYSRILWSKAFREHHEKYTEYYIDRILHEYEPKLVDSLPRVIQAIQREIEMRPKVTEPGEVDEGIIIKEFKYLEDLDEEFYSIMNEEREKLGL